VKDRGTCCKYENQQVFCVPKSVVTGCGPRRLVLRDLSSAVKRPLPFAVFQNEQSRTPAPTDVFAAPQSTLPAPPVATLCHTFFFSLSSLSHREDKHRSQGSLCRICYKRRSSVRGFSPSTSVLSCHLFSHIGCSVSSSIQTVSAHRNI